MNAITPRAPIRHRSSDARTTSTNNIKLTVSNMTDFHTLMAVHRHE